MKVPGRHYSFGSAAKRHSKPSRCVSVKHKKIASKIPERADEKGESAGDDSAFSQRALHDRDLEIRAEIRAAIEKNATLSFDRVLIQVRSGTVIVKGTIESEVCRLALLRILANVPGVDAVSSTVVVQHRL